MADQMSFSYLEGNGVGNDVSFFSMFKSVVTKTPKKIAVSFRGDNGEDRSITFETMNDMSNSMARVLQRYVLPTQFENTIIAVSLKPSELLPMILLAVMKSGMSYLPIDVDSPVDRIRHIISDSKPSLCIIETREDAYKYCNTSTITQQELKDESKEESGLLEINEELSRVALILYTSGSTGSPKGVRLQYSALMNRLMWQWRELPYNLEEECCVFKTALTFVDSVCEIWGPLLQSRTLIVIPKDVTKDPQRLTSILNEYKIQRIVLVPSLLKTLLINFRLQKNEGDMESLKLWICSGEVLSASLVHNFFSHFSGQGKHILNLYGSTEMMGDVTFYSIDEDDAYLKVDTIPIGKPIDNCSVYIVDEELNLLPSGNVGELLVAGRNLADGYVSHNDSHKFVCNPFSSGTGFARAFRTGDHARIQNNQLFYEGRQDSQVKIRGHRVDISEIERTVLSLQVVKDTVVLSHQNDQCEQVLLCFIVLKEQNNTIDTGKMKLLLVQALPDYMIPELIIIPEIPLLFNGKTDRQKLIQLYMASQERSDEQKHNYDLTNVPEELQDKARFLFSIISSVIGLKDMSHISTGSNFYELGGNSLNSVYTVLKLRENGFHIGITDFITASTIGDILSRIKTDYSIDIIKDSINPSDYLLEMLNDTHKDGVIKMITDSFITKADLERWLLPDISRDDYNDLMQELWGPLVDKNFSFVIEVPSTHKILSVALNFDARDEPEVVIKSKLMIIFEFLEYLEKPIRDKRLPAGKNQIFHTFMMATSNDISPAENVILMRLMEQKCLEIAKKNCFSGILTTNTSPLTQQLGTDIFKYDVMLDYQVNEYTTADGCKPFAKAPDNQRAIVSWKAITHERMKETSI